MRFIPSLAIFFDTVNRSVRLLRHPISSIRALTARSPLTIQTYILLTFCAYLLIGPVRESSDIVSASLAWGLLATIAIISVVTTLHALRVKKLLSTIELLPPNDAVISGEQSHYVLLFPSLRLLPGAFVQCDLEFAHPLPSASQVRLHGSWDHERRVPLYLTFPHRGNWDISGIRCCVGDVSGFIRVSWTIPHQTSITVSPPTMVDSNLPLISSTQRPGDLTPDTIHRYGDPFDIKPYHPADGIKKIVWKAYAKSGQLLSRHPEPSMTPEGFVAICVFARSSDDDVCGQALAYTHALTELKLDIMVGCEGHRGRPLATDPDAARTLLIDSVWDADGSHDESRSADIQALIDSCSQGDNCVTLRSMVLFCSGSRLTTNADATSILAHASWLEEQGIEPVFFLTQPKDLRAPNARSLKDRAREWLVEPENDQQAPRSPSSYQSFLTTCLARQWEVFT